MCRNYGVGINILCMYEKSIVHGTAEWVSISSIVIKIGTTYDQKVQSKVTFSSKNTTWQYCVQRCWASKLRRMHKETPVITTIQVLHTKIFSTFWNFDVNFSCWKNATHLCNIGKEESFVIMVTGAPDPHCHGFSLDCISSLRFRFPSFERKKLRGAWCGVNLSFKD